MGSTRISNGRNLYVSLIFYPGCQEIVISNLQRKGQDIDCLGLLGMKMI
ncbi:hypothetical protein [Methanobacterium sp. SMA-27]|nr:hypothetical protein [Methanobacterium sp. SMA-27]